MSEAALTQVVLDVERHVAASGWDQAPRIYGVVDTAQLVEHGFGAAYKLQMNLVRKAIAAGELKAHRPEQIIIMMHAAAATFYTVAPLAQQAFKSNARDPKTRAASLSFRGTF